jgi:hypothetical protein
MKNAVFCDATPCGSCENPGFKGTFSVKFLRLLVMANVAPSPLIHPTMTTEAIRSSET